MKEKLLQYWLLLLLLPLLAVNSYSQKIDKVITELSGNNIHIYYDLSEVEMD